MRCSVIFDEAFGTAVNNAFQIAGHPNGPRHRGRKQLEHVFYFVNEFKRRPAGPIAFINESENGYLSLSANLEQLERLRFNAL